MTEIEELCAAMSAMKAIWRFFHAAEKLLFLVDTNLRHSPFVQFWA